MELSHFINGARAAGTSGRFADVFNPATGEVQSQVPLATKDETDTIITASDIDAVIIATPTTFHYDQIHALAAAGKAIFCEKPIDLSSERAAECMAAVKTALFCLVRIGQYIKSTPKLAEGNGHR